MPTAKELYEAIEWLRAGLTTLACGGSMDLEEYVRTRGSLLRESRVCDRLPLFLKKCRTTSDFWGFIKNKFAHYQERRDFLREEFEPILTSLENEGNNPVEQSAANVLERVDSEHVQAAWRRALDRREIDPEGAITAARSLLESLCKHILDETKVAYDDKSDLPKLYSAVAAVLTLSPAQHTEQIFRQILGGCHAVVEGLGAMRNRMSDAHGKGQKGVRPAPRHAELAVNLAGTVATFLVSTWEVRRNQHNRPGGARN